MKVSSERGREIAQAVNQLDRLLERTYGYADRSANSDTLSDMMMLTAKLMQDVRELQVGD